MNKNNPARKVCTSKYTSSFYGSSMKDKEFLVIPSEK